MRKISIYFNEKQQQFLLVEDFDNNPIHYSWELIGRITATKAESFTHLIDEINFKGDKIFTIDDIKNYFSSFNNGDTL